MKFICTKISLILMLTACSLFNPETGVTDALTFFSSSTGATSTIVVYYPEDYSSSTPIIYLLNGMGADAFAWGSGMDLAGEAYSRDIILVSLTAGSHTYTNDPNDPNDQYEDYVLEVVAEVEDEYEIGIDSSRRALCGISNGGGGAVYLLSQHPELFAAAGSLSGSYYSGTTISNIPDHSIRIDVGTDDGLASQLRWLHKKLDEAGISHEYYEHPGEHNWDFWEIYCPKQFDFLEEVISK